MHRPEIEFLTLNPKHLTDLLFGGAPYLGGMRRQYSQMPAIIKNHGVPITDSIQLDGGHAVAATTNQFAVS